MSRALEAERQQALVRALLNRQDLAPGLDAVVPGAASGVTLARGLAAYRVNARALAARSLAAAYPLLHQELGAADFEAMAWSLWRRHPPERGDLGEWGEALAGFLAEQPGMDPMLPDLARIEWALTRAERAADAVLDEASLQRLGTQAPAALRLRLRPGLALLRVRADAAARLDVSTDGAGLEAAAPIQLTSGLDPRPGGRDADLLVWRLGWRARACRISSAVREFIAACLAGASLEQALLGTLQLHPDFDFSAWLQAALTHAWLQDVVSVKESE